MRVRAEGQLVEIEDSKARTVEYQIELDIPDGLSKGEALGLVQNSRLTPLLKGQFKHFNRWRTCQIVKLRDSEPQPEPVDDTEEFEPEFQDRVEQSDEFSDKIPLAPEEPEVQPQEFKKVSKKKTRRGQKKKA